MNALEFLSQYSDLLARIRELDCDIQIAEDNLTRVTASYDGDGCSGGDPVDRRRTKEARLGDLIVKKANLEYLAEQKRQEIWDKIDGLSDYRHRKVLQLHYCDGRSFAEIGKLLGYCDRSIYYFHRRGMDIMQREMVL